MKTQKTDLREYLGSLSDKAFKSGDSLGRRHREIWPDELPYLHARINDQDMALAGVLDPFLLDKEKIRLSKSFRRLTDKTQVFMNHKENGHIRNRKIHTDEVASYAVQIAAILGLNVNLVEAGAFGHDLGHAPFGHLGERVISKLAGRPFRHEIMSVVLAQKIERGGRGLNLSFETLDCILKHSRGKHSLVVGVNDPLEYAVVMLADKIAYTFSDLNDALRCNFFKTSQLPPELELLGSNQRERWLKCLSALVKESSEAGAISFSKSEEAQKFEAIRQWSYENFYYKLDEGEGRRAAVLGLHSIYDFLGEWVSKFGYYDPLMILALLTDYEATRISSIAVRPTVKDIEDVFQHSFMEFIARFPRGHEVDIFNPDLDPESFSQPEPVLGI